MSSIGEAASGVRRPEYTGENRCVPCTVVNVLIAAAVAAVLAGVSVGVATAAFVLALLVIYLRGYLVPGTPTITKRYLPASVLRAFGKRPDSAGVTVAEDAESNEALAAAGIVEVDRDGTHRLAPGFREEWRDRIRNVRSRGPTDEDVATLFAADTLDRHGETSFVLDGTKSLRWDSEGALVADVAAGGLLRSAFDDWGTIDPTTREELLRRLRLLLDRCPGCDGPVETVRHHADPCCQPPFTVVESVCGECEEPLTTMDVSDAHAEPWRELGVLEPEA
jgi:hypothetical protein